MPPETATARAPEERAAGSGDRAPGSPRESSPQTAALLPFAPRGQAPRGAAPPPAYAELACTTNFSFLRGASHPEELVARAVELGHAAIGVADRNTLAGVVRAHVAAKKAGLRLLVGARLVSREGLEALCFPTDRAAYGRLSRLLTAGKRAAPKGECDFGLEDMLAQAEGQVLVALPPVAQVAEEGFAAALARLAAAAPGRVWLGLAHRHGGDDRARLARLARLAGQAGVPLLAHNDVHYHTPDRRPLQDVLTCIREGVTVAQAGFRLAANAERHLKPAAEMARLFAAWPGALAAIGEVLSLCRFSLDELAYNYPSEPVPKGSTPQAHLEALTRKGAEARYPKGVPEEVTRLLEKELALIGELGYAPYFLTVHDMVAFARSRGILCQGRGSAANSAVCFCLGITAVDPAKSQLLFERFISRARKEPPDIDVDFEHERREEVIQHVYARYGRHRAALAATVISYRPRSAVRDVGRAMGLTEDVTAALASTVWGSWGEELPAEEIRAAGLDLSDPLLARTVALTTELLGFPRHLSQHVGGFVLTEDPLEEIVPIGNAAMPDRTFIEWDKDDIEALGILKVDVLALGMLSCLARAFGMLRAWEGIDHDLASIPQADDSVYAMLSAADAIGVFQVESRAQLNMLPRLRPKVFYDLVIEVAIVRPGPIQGDMVHPYLRRRDGLERVEYPAPDPRHGDPDELRRVLDRTMGVPLFQEQAMQIAIAAAEFTGDEANELRRAMATFRNPGTIHALEERMVGRMIARGYTADFASRCFEQIKGFGQYGFPESHAASFAILVYASAWVKRHHPAIFCAALLNSQPMGFYAPAQLVRDARGHGVEVRPVDVLASDWDCTLEPGEAGPALRLGFRQVDGLPEAAMRAFVSRRAALMAAGLPGAGPSPGPVTGAQWPPAAEEERKVPRGGPASGRAQMTAPEAEGAGFARPPGPAGAAAPAPGWLSGLDAFRAATGLSRALLERLAAADALGGLGLDRRQGLWAVRGLGADGGLPLFEAAGETGSAAEPEVRLPAMRLSEQVVADYQTHRLSLKAHPMSFLRARHAARGTRSATALGGTVQNQRVRVSGVVLVRQRPGTAQGVVFMTIEDETGTVNIVIWRKVLARFRRAVMTARLVQVSGVVQRTGDIIHVIAGRIDDLSDELSLLSETDDMPEALARADEVKRPEPGSRRPSRAQHPRNVRILPKSRDFH
ncbi:error-prone DNA polymerase [Oceanicella sp. SM1341]|uniref:error-prone DNA polymerase n=1 Tax=Oceanicella sp. SM1341 TaxID=1548889 RepID=UPI000E4B26E4|nr:error-prone DNA polymerase [Oceanicella sp. SM1341]